MSARHVQVRIAKGRTCPVEQVPCPYCHGSGREAAS